tara:strand:+ start:64 stop:1005 length:942 start_codon:yes stop_codon:yes gene_type:complete
VQKTLVLLSLIFLAFGCGLSKEEEVDDAISQAHRLLSANKCAEAIAVLNGVGQQTSNADWLGVYADAQACLAPWSVVSFFATDLPNMSTSQSAIIGSLATFQQAVMTSPSDGAYTNLRAGMNTLLYAGGLTQVSHSNRVSALGLIDANNIGVHALYMMINQIGQFSRYYGNALATTGVKGSGGGSECYINYTDLDAQTIVGAYPAANNCNSIVLGHAQLTGNRARLCDGIVLFNNFLDVIGNIAIGDTGNNGGLDELATNIGDLCAAAAGGGLDLGGTCTVKTHSVCLNDTNGDISAAQIERFYAVTWEAMHQ